MNVPPTIHAAINSGLTTMTELNTTLGLEGLYDILEIAEVNAHNDRLVERRRADRDKP